MGKKTESLLKLADLDVNTPNIKIMRSGVELSNFLKCNMGGWERISIRTDTKKEYENYRKWGLPFYPYQTKEEFKKILRQELLELVDKSIDILVAEGINPQDVLISGKYFKSTNRDIIEYILGPSTVRDVDRSIPKHWDLSLESPPRDFNLVSADLGELLCKVNRIIFLRFKIPFVVEFSIYPYPVGKLKKTLIFWEVIEEGGRRP